MKCLGDYKFRSKGNYYTTVIPIDRLKDFLRESPAIVDFYIKDLGHISRVISLDKMRSSFVELYFSKERYNIDPNQLYKIYFVKVSPVTKLHRKVIVYSGGRKARIEIPQWYLRDRVHDEAILKVEAEIAGSRRSLFSRYSGEGPAIQAIPTLEDGSFPDTIDVINVSEYSLEDFITDFNKLIIEMERFKHLELHLDERLYLIVDNKKIEIKEYIFSTYSYYVYLLFRIVSGSDFKTIRINNYGNSIKIFYIRHSKKQKLTEHSSYFPIETIYLDKDNIMIEYYNTQKKKISKAKLTLL